jgi:hypothetical protein
MSRMVRAVARYGDRFLQKTAEAVCRLREARESPAGPRPARTAGGFRAVRLNTL